MVRSQELRDLTVIDEGKLKFLGRCFDQLIYWGRETLESTAPEICRWLRTHQVRWPARKPFKMLQEQSTVKRYVGHFKQLIYYTFRTGLLDNETCERMYGIRFTSGQKQLIHEIFTMLSDCKNDSLLEEDSDEDESDADDDIDGVDSDIEDLDDEPVVFEDLVVETSQCHGPAPLPIESKLSIRVAEKLLQLCIQFLNQRFPTGYDPHSPMLHFSAVLAIQTEHGRFRDSTTCTSLLAGLIWTSRLPVLEYALPKREYATFGLAIPGGVCGSSHPFP